LNPEPYFNEAGYEKQKGTQVGFENSRLYNEMAVLKLVQVCVIVYINIGYLYKFCVRIFIYLKLFSDTFCSSAVD